ncbi:hypothetical protein M5689_014931 [Euphorbia peplus]|nr:hypothetical protein M5689_014931 [Euphorbia peplus]
MAANKFATMLHRKTNKLTLILVYAFLEWLLIFFLLLNSLFSYLIIKFADYFGLKKPCLWCSRLDNFFEPQKFQDSYRSLVCEAHAIEISKLGYCSSHRKLAESQDMCEDCLSSGETSKNFVFFPWMKKLGVLQDFNGDDKVSENDLLVFKCSCCGVRLDENSFCHDDFLIKPFWGDSENTMKENLILEDEFDDQDHSDTKVSGFVEMETGEKQGIDENRGEKTGEKFLYSLCSFNDEMVVDESVEADLVMEKERDSGEVEDRNSSCNEEVRVEARELSSESQTQHLEFYIDEDACNLIPVEIEVSGEILDRNGKEEEKTCGDEDFVMEFEKHGEAQYELVLESRGSFEEKVPLLPILECHEEDDEDDEIIVELGARELNETHDYSELLADFEHVREDEMESHNIQVIEESEGEIQMQIDEIEADISIGTEIPDHETMDHKPMEDIHIPSQEISPSTSNSCYGSRRDEEQVEFPSMNSPLSFCSESNEIEEEKVPDTPTSEDNAHHLNKKFLLLERRESNTEESLDGSVTSDIEGGDGVLTMDKLKSALRAERKALNAVYAELEEERSASAVAANQTMAMINRLQEEKAAMQMEALQYQRMMEEQSEYDQEALQLMNELMVKREKERAELEKELELYRKRIEDYEARERQMMLKRRKESSARSTATSSASFSNGEESDGLSVDLNHELKDENGFGLHQESSNENTPVDAVVYLEDSLANFEEERLSILDQLKVLEEKLFTLSEDDEKEHLHLENGNGNGYNDNFEVENAHYKEMNGRHTHHHHMGTKAKRLLPLFDATEGEGDNEDNDEEMVNGHTEAEDVDSVMLMKSINKYEEAEEVDSAMLMKSINKYEVDTKKLEIEETVDHVYERLQALEADREFLKHCMTSLKKGDKGIQLLQEILQHLRDLRNVEVRAKSMENGVA